jgi:hypothetical protein
MNRMRVMMAMVGGLLSGCAGMKLAQARSTVSVQSQCPESRLNVWEANEGWWWTAAAPATCARFRRARAPSG